MQRIVVLFLTCFLIVGLAWASPPSQADAIPISYGDTVQGTISAEVPSIVYSFNGQQGDQIEVAVTSVGLLDPFVALSSNTGALLKSDDDGGGEPNALLTSALPGSGTYFLTVSRSPESAETDVGDFTLVLSADPANALPPSSSDITDGETISRNITTDSRLQNIPLNSNVDGSFTGTEQFNVYWFEGQQDQQIVVRPNITAEISPLIVLYRSDLSEIVRAQPGEPLDVTLEAADIYFLAVASLSQAATGRYSFEIIDQSPAPEIEVGNDVLVYGQAKSGFISNTNPVIRYRFQAETGDNISIEMTASDGDLDSYVILLNAGGASLAEDDNSGGGANARISTFSIPASGEYFVIATRTGQESGLTSGTFNIVINSDAPPRVPEDSAPTIPEDYVGLPEISYGETVRGTVSNENFLNIYVFFAEAGDAITATMEADDTTLDPLLVLLDQNRIPLTENDDIDPGVVRDSQLEFTIPTTGYYAIVATRFEQAEGDSSGSYSLTLTADGAPTVDVESPLIERLNATPLTPGPTPSFNFQPLRLGSLYTFPVAAGNLIDFSVTADGGQQATLILTDSNLETIASSDNSVLLAITAPATDDYYVLVIPQSGPAQSVDANYFVSLNIEVDDGTGSDTDVEITYGTTVTARITDNTSTRRYIFNGEAGDIVHISMTAEDTLDTLLRLFGPDGELLQENDDIEAGVIRNSQIRVTLPASGEYTIVATRYEGTDATPTTGDFELSLAVQDPTTVGVDREAVDIGYGETVEGVIDEEIFLKFYYFVGRQGDQIAITVNTTDGNLDAILYLYAFTSDDEPFFLTANDDSPTGATYDPYIEYTLPRSGPYLIGVTRFADEDREPTSGVFNITVELLSTPGAQPEETVEESTPEVSQ